MAADFMSYSNQGILWNFILPHRLGVKTDFGFLSHFNEEKHLRVFLFPSLSQILLIYFLSSKNILTSYLLLRTWWEDGTPSEI